MINRREFIMNSIAGSALGLGAISSFSHPFQSADEIKIGIVGLDTSHSGAFTKIINDPKNPKMQGVRVAFAHPYGSARADSWRPEKWQIGRCGGPCRAVAGGRADQRAGP